MRTAIVAVVGLSMLPVLSGGAIAQEERYRLERTEDGYVRMDTETGAMTLCRERSGELVCSTAAEDRQAPGSDAAGLRQRISELEARVEALEKAAGTDLPLEEEFEQSLNLMERFFRRFVDIVRGIEEDIEQTPNEPKGPAERT